jgi:hypothetical protein
LSTLGPCRSMMSEHCIVSKWITGIGSSSTCVPTQVQVTAHSPDNTPLVAALQFRQLLHPTERPPETGRQYRRLCCSVRPASPPYIGSRSLLCRLPAYCAWRSSNHNTHTTSSQTTYLRLARSSNHNTHTTSSQTTYGGSAPEALQSEMHVGNIIPRTRTRLEDPPDTNRRTCLVEPADLKNICQQTGPQQQTRQSCAASDSPAKGLERRERRTQP